MKDFTEFMKTSAFPDIVIQMALRDIDSELLATVLADQGEEIRDLIFGNMSLRAVAYLKEEVKDPDSLPPGALEAAQAHLGKLLQKHLATWKAEGAFPPAPKPPEIDLSSREAIIDTFSKLMQFVRREGILPLDEIRATTTHPMLQQGLQMLVEGWDPLLMRSVLERYKESWLRAQEIEYELLIEGIDSLASRDHALVTKQKLRSYVAGL
ncbi:MAG: hypothetical protein M0001_11190 [Treponema sp.]|nr:hypothetical protein [Treponema sp.]